MIISLYSELFECKNNLVLEKGSRLGKQQGLFPKLNTFSFIANLLQFCKYILKYITKSTTELQVFINFYMRIIDYVNILLTNDIGKFCITPFLPKIFIRLAPKACC